MNEKIKQRFQTVLEKEQVLEAESMSRSGRGTEVSG